MKKFIPVFILIGVARSCRRLHNRIPHWNADSGSFRGAGELWLGLWQGLIIYLSFIASWFDNNVVLYQNNNNGFWYNFGYLIGLWITIGVFDRRW
ncbi:MAG: hypothetical protein ACXVI5_07040 [Halobacteriota archaeon]